MKRGSSCGNNSLRKYVSTGEKGGGGCSIGEVTWGELGRVLLGSRERTRPSDRAHTHGL